MKIVTTLVEQWLEARWQMSGRFTREQPYFETIVHPGRLEGSIGH